MLFKKEIKREDYVKSFVYSNKEDSPYGSDVIAHAITPNGDNLIVSKVETNQNEGDHYGDV
jgi:hypothetical protein